MVKINKKYMIRAIELGEKARNATGDNPWVGCVIVKENKNT